MSIFLNVGCGPCHIEGFVNLDIEPDHKPDVLGDCIYLTDHFANNSIDALISIHCIEHLGWPDDVQDFFEAAHLVLKPHATLRIVVPDLMKVAKLYVAGDDLKGIYGPEFDIGPGPDCSATRFMHFCRAWQHKVLFDERLLRMLMEQAGFVNIRVMPFGESDVPELRGLDRMPAESLSMECEKCQ